MSTLPIPKDVALTAGEALRRLTNRVSHRSGKVFDMMNKAGITLPQVVLLSRVEGFGSASLSDLAAASPASAPAVSQMTDRLVQQGYLRRAEDPADRRRKAIRVTPTAEALLRRIEAARAEDYDFGLAAMDPQLKQRLTEVLRQAVADLEAPPVKGRRGNTARRQIGEHGMTREQWLMLLIATLSVFAVGQVWLVQMSSYRLFAYVGVPEFRAYHMAWWRSIWGVVLAPAALLFLAALLQLWWRTPGVPAWATWLGFGLQLCLLAGTAAWWGPLMARLEDARGGLATDRYALLMATHWLRVALVSAYGLLAIWMLATSAWRGEA